MEVLLFLILVVLGVLNIILFFKIWGMTNNVSIIKDAMLQKEELFTPQKETNKENSGIQALGIFKVGDLVVRKSDDKQMRITRITEEGKFECYSQGGTHYDGLLAEEDIMSWDEFISTYKKK